MLDCRFIGKAGIIIQYEDIISTPGFNIVKYLKDSGVDNKKINSMSTVELLSSYLERDEYDINKWLKTFDIEIDMDKYYTTSKMTMKPNLVYSYKLFNSAKIESIHDMYVYSNTYSPIIENNISVFQNSEIKYIYGNIADVMKDKFNYTFITSFVDNVDKCIDMNIPMTIVLCDDYNYAYADYISNDKIKNNNHVFMAFTSVVNAGII